MSDHIYKKIELVGASATSIEDAVTNALTRAQKTIRNMRWFEGEERQPHHRAQDSTDRQTIQDETRHQRAGDGAPRVFPHILFGLLEDLLELVFRVAKPALRNVAGGS